QWGISSELVKVVIADEGEGFVPEDVPDPTDDENLERPCGRGIMLMRAFMDTIEYNEVGNVLTIEKKKSSEDSEE
ncbi:MAG TPA: ATP-binding protein, partial [Planctomycetaceae bacterium]|nr:ATP-binding protein [Planctomycetaceae bacterium]